MGTFGSLVTLRLQQKSQREQEERAWQRARRDKLETAAQAAAGELMKNVAAAAHSMEWVLWIASHTEEDFEDAHIDTHDRAMGKFYANIVANQLLVASYKRSLYEETKDIVDQLYVLDGRLAKRLRKDKQRGTEVEDLWVKVYEYRAGMAKQVADLLVPDDERAKPRARE